MSNNHITITSACEHNLKNISLKIPRNTFTVITGLSGSGKSSLAFDTIYAEGQRRYVESLSAYARQFLDQLQKPNVEHIEGLSPTIAIEQKTTSHNPRSTVATQTEIYDFLRLLFARVGIPHCPKCNKAIKRQSAQEIVEQILRQPEGTKIVLMAPLIRGKKGEYRQIPNQVSKAGFARFRADGVIYSVDEKISLDRYKVHDIDIIIDRLTIKADVKKRLTDSVETALAVGKGILIVSGNNKHKDFLFSEHYACIDCGINISEIEPRIFSFNSPYGACPSCNGLGTKMEIDPDRLVPDPEKPWVYAIAPWRRGRHNYMMYYRAVLKELADLYDVDLDIPYSRLTPKFKKILLHGSEDEIWGKTFTGVLAYMQRLFAETDSDWLKDEISKYMSIQPCPTCKGKRLKDESLAVKINGMNIADITSFSTLQATDFFKNILLSKEETIIAEQILKEILRRLNFCINVGLDYLTLDRRSSTLSGGEAERIRLATQVGSGLVGVVYVLDEPSIGLHQKDNQRLLNTLHSLRDLGNTLIVVEHDESTIRNADFIVDLGPGAGIHGGEVIFAGPSEDLLKCAESLTGKYLRGDYKIPIPEKRRPINPQKALFIEGASANNLKNINVKFPLGTLICVTGVSGSGKSSLIEETLYPALSRHLSRSKNHSGHYSAIKGIEHIDKVIVVDQSPIGRTPRSNPATYTGVFSHVRSLFSNLPESKMRGYKPGRFSFNVKGGRCESCKGDGIKKIEMHFLPDVYVECETCHGRRFNEQTLDVYFKDKNIFDVLDMSVEETNVLFENIPPIARILQTLIDVGLGYIKLGQSATTLSGGEAQRVKLASELCKQATGNTLYILDEPTTGLHFADVHKLLDVLQRLVDLGNTVIVVEHNLDIIKNADYIIDLGPDGGDKGGTVVFTGSPEDIINHPQSYTGQYLRPLLIRM
ncbi:MAG: excinuclease ABC subunit UvrA [Candidatus Omnitrophota bacterium]